MFLWAPGTAAPALGVCLPAPKYLFLGTELYIGYHKTALVLSQREAS